MTNDKICRKMGANGHDRATKYFSSSENVNKLSQCIKTTISICYSYI